MESDHRSSSDSLDEILNNLEDSESDQDLISEKNCTIIDKTEIRNTIANKNSGSDISRTIHADGDVCDDDRANIFTDNDDKISDASDKNDSHLNLVDVKKKSPLHDTEESNDVKDDASSCASNDTGSKSENLQGDLSLQKETHTAKASNDANLKEEEEIQQTSSNNENTSEVEKSALVQENNSILVAGKNSNPSSSDKCKDGFIIAQYLDNSQAEAEARLAARRAARAEAREIRMREVERQQREQEENADRQFDMQEPMLASSGPANRPSTAAAMLRTTPNMRLTPASAGSYLSSRRSSEDSLEDTGNLRDLRHELKDVEEKFRKAMIANAQLDNDKSSQTYQLELLKDRIEELEEAHAQLRREHRDKCRNFDQLQRQADRLKQDLDAVRFQLEDRDRLIAEKGLVIVGGEDDLSEDGSFLDTSLTVGSSGMVNGGSTPKRALVSAENAQMLDHAGEGSLDVRLARFAKERSEFQDIVSHLRLELEEERNRRRKNSGMLNGPTSEADIDDQHRVASKQLDDYKFRAQKAEQDVATLQANVARLESQVTRYKSSAEASEKSEEALKTEKRKLQREARDAQSRAEELETANTHLIKRLDKLKTAKSALLKEL